MALDLHRIRAETPGCHDLAFFDSAGSSLPPAPVLDTVIGHLRREAEVGGYRAAAERAADLAAVKDAIGALIGAPAGTIALSDSATRAWCDFFYAVPLRAGQRIVVTGVDYASNAIAALQRARAAGAEVVVLPSDADGRVDLDALDAVLDERVALVSLVHVPTNSGLVAPVREIADRAHAVGAPVLLDACQSVGQVTVDARELGVDALTATGRKWLRGPRGTGFLYVRPELIERIEPRSLDLHSAQWVAEGEYCVASDAARFETWEADVAARLGLGAAVRYLLELGPDHVFAAITRRAAGIRERLAALPAVTVRDPVGGALGGIVSFTVDGVDPDRVQAALFDRGVVVSVTRRGSTLRDMTARGLTAAVRASAHAFVSDVDVDRLVDGIVGLDVRPRS
ncbi:aminotransferase class V-fold PLP-dependent enzyme [Tsukamurella soli]|uniref:Probable hercynylcysteine sulfoxide lyase n=1 Tax=Tsukamurella soli TaxID=644556 RepID=A0ABP8J1J9_9ACTN